MALTVVADVGGADSNAFQDLDDVSDRLLSRLDSAAWDDAEPEERAKAVVTATQELSTLPFLGRPTSATQALVFPRTGVPDPDPPDDGPYLLPDDEMPELLLEAHAEACLFLLQRAAAAGGLYVEPEPQLKRRKVDVIDREWFEREESPRGITAAERVMTIVAPLLQSMSTQISRV